MLQREGDVGPRHGEALHDIEAGGIFGARERRNLRRAGTRANSLDADARAGRQRGRAFRRPRAPLSTTRAPAFGAAHPAFDRQRATLAIEGSASPRKPSVDVSIASSGSLEVAWRSSASAISAGHAASVVGHFDADRCRRPQADGDPRGPGVDRVFDQFLQRAGGAFDHLAGCDTIDKMLGKAAY
jgi:hypothetical protein